MSSSPVTKPARAEMRAEAAALLAAARALAARVGPVMPVRGKVPLWDKWQLLATRSPNGEPEWSSATGIGLLTGERAGYFVLDVDAAKDGLQALDELEREHGALPATWTSCTGGGGRHYFFRWPAFPVRGSAGKLGPGLDVRGEGGQVVAPPSRHPSGTVYRWAEGRGPEDLELAAAPAWLLERLQALQTPATSSPGGGASADVLRRAAAYLVRIPGAISGSGGHDQTWKAALVVVRGFGLSEADAFALLSAEYNPRCEPPWSEKELRHKVQQAARNASVAWGYLRDAPARTSAATVRGEPEHARREVPPPGREPGSDDGEESDEAPGWGLTWLEDFLAREFPPARWLYLDLVQARTTCVVVAPPNAGKTLLAFDLGAQIVAAAIGRGAKGLRAAIVEEEGTGAALQQRLLRAFAAAGGMPKQAVKVAWNSGRDLANTIDLEQLAAECAGADLVVLDSLADLSNVDENDPGEMKLLSKCLRKLQTLTGATVIALHHMTKEVWSRGQIPTLRHLRGHGALAAKVDTVLALVPGEEESGRVNFDLYCLKQRDGEKARPRRVAVEMVGPAATVSMESLELKGAGPGDRGEVDADALTAEILGRIPLANHGGVISKAKLAKELRRNEKAVSAAVDELIDSGKVRVLGTWGLVQVPPPNLRQTTSATSAEPPPGGGSGPPDPPPPPPPSPRRRGGGGGRRRSAGSGGES